MERWQFARELFDEHFAPLVQAGFELERVPNPDAYWQLHEAELRAHFPKEVGFNLPALRSDREREGQARLAETRADNPLLDFTVVRRQGAVVAMFSGEQKTDAMYRMWHSNVHPDFRRQGLYRMIVQATIRYTAALGFDTITSEHAPCNNPILIAKLRAGFRIYAFDLDAMVGPSVVLRYFHNPEHLAAYELRCGNATLTSGLRDNARGAFALFRDQVRGS
jgi:ribosomal protein S18 acetylase RimI-like enzyme